MKQRVDQRSAIAGVFGGARAGVHHHAGGLVDDGEVVVFINDVERNVFGDGAEGRALGLAENRDALTAAEFHGRFRGRVVYQNVLVSDDLLDAGTADVEAGGEELIEALSGGVRVDREGCGGGHGFHEAGGAVPIFFFAFLGKLLGLLRLGGEDLVNSAHNIESQ